ncbi:MAG: ectonucleotide pyrophosphatase/phosphodiesterase [Woeseia sp.]
MFNCGKRILNLLALTFVLASSISCNGTSSTATGQHTTGTGGINSESRYDKAYIVLISIDGFGWDYTERFEIPALDRLIERGVRAESLKPVYPTLTFPNHYSIATGAYPAEHGIVANRFPHEDPSAWYNYKDRDTVQDGSWYGGEPIWVAAERAGMVSAAYFFVGTEAPVDGISPSHWYPYSADVPGNERVDQVLRWLKLPEERRPHVVTLYFEDVDTASHRYGPDSPENMAAVKEVNGYLSRLLDGIEALTVSDEVYVVVVSDHGQSVYRDRSATLVLDEIIDLDGIALVEGGSYAFLFLDGSDAVRATRIRDTVNEHWQHGRAWLRAEAPAEWQLGHGARVADVILQPDPGYAVLSTAEHLDRLNVGAHGWAPEFRDMHGIFIAAGGRLPSGCTVGTAEAIEVYPLLLEILGLPDRRTNRWESALDDLLEPGGAERCRR